MDGERHRNTGSTHGGRRGSRRSVGAAALAATLTACLTVAIAAAAWLVDAPPRTAAAKEPLRSPASPEPAAVAARDTPVFVPLQPARLLDTRPGFTTIDGESSGVGEIAGGTSLQLVVTGRGGIPDDAEAAALSITAVDPVDDGYLTVHRCDAPRPVASSLNYRAGRTTGNLAVVRSVANSRICIYSRATTHLTVDATAYVPDGGVPDRGEDLRLYVPVTAVRLLDTRPGLATIDGEFDGIGAVDAGTTLRLTIAGRGGIPSDAAAVLVNLTAVDPADDGHLIVHSCDAPRPTASHLNYRAGDVVGNAAIVELDAHGTVCIFSRAATDVVVDATGFVPVGVSPPTIEPARLLDTRPGLATVDDQFDGIGLLTAGTTLQLAVAGRDAVPADAIAVIVNVTAVGPTDDGYVTIHPCNTTKPNASSLNYRAGRTTGNTTIGKLDLQGRVCIYSRATTHLVVDAVGFVRSRASASERTALEALHHSTDGPNWDRDDRWLRDADPCVWRGVTCEAEGVVAIGLGGNGLSGAIPPEINGLDNLERLFLAANEITAVPAEIGEVASLTRLFFGDNRLTTIPSEVGELAKLTRLGLERNQLTAIPAELGDLTGLTHLYLSANRITSLPAEIGNLGRLVHLGAAANRLTALPGEVGRLTSLDWASFDGNLLTSLPPQIGDLTGLHGLTLSNNRLATLPPEIGGLTELEYFTVEANLLTSLPDEVGNMSGLTNAWFSDNDLTGDITVPMAGLRDAATSLVHMEVEGRGCPTISDPAVEAWVEGFDPDWNAGCG